MADDSYRTIRTLLASNSPEEIRKGLRLIAIEIAKFGSNEARPLFAMVTALFYIDVLDRPEFVPILDEAVSLTATFGAWVIPILIEDLDAGDIKSQWAVAHVLGRVGAPAIDPMLRAYAATSNITLRAFILYALGKIKSPEIVRAVQVALEAAESSDLELRDTATRTLGKMIESIPPAILSGELKQEMIECLAKNLSDSNVRVRSKAIRSLGKLGKYGHLTGSEREQFKIVCRRILGKDEKFEWDSAFILRKEAEEALAYF
jgi:HEAT repeat protein